MRGEKRDVEEWEQNYEIIAPVSLGKLYGMYGNPKAVGPDPFYKLTILKDESKANKTNRNESIGVTAHLRHVCSHTPFITIPLPLSPVQLHHFNSITCPPQG